MYLSFFSYKSEACKDTTGWKTLDLNSDWIIIFLITAVHVATAVQGMKRITVISIGDSLFC